MTITSKVCLILIVSVTVENGQKTFHGALNNILNGLKPQMYSTLKPNISFMKYLSRVTLSRVVTMSGFQGLKG